MSAPLPPVKISAPSPPVILNAALLPVAKETSMVRAPPSLAVNFALLAFVELFFVALVAVKLTISVASNVAPAFTITTSLSPPEAPPRSRTVSVPESTVIISLSVPPVIISSPAPPVIVSIPPLPVIVST
ncbi:MAG: hypothetical protein CML39_07600 [Rhodobacteraceae bacterium]|nr:MAG: hypothetical protein CML39_07600 [Paracoccaceae bacterium]